MGKLTKKEISLLDEIIDEITLEFFSQSEDIWEKDKLVFSVCNNDAERQKYIFNAIEEMQLSIKKSPAKMAAYLTGIKIHPPEIKDRFEKRFEQAVISLILDDYIEAFDELKQNKNSVDSYVQYFNQFYEYKEEWRMLESLLQYSLILNRLEIFNDLRRVDSGQVETVAKQEQPKSFEELFYNPENAEPCLRILSELQPPVIDEKNNYIGKAKGVFPLWVKILKNHKPEPIIKHFKDAVYKDLLNQKIKGLNLSKDASEFRKQYKRVENDRIELDIRAILSQYSQTGKLGK